MLKNEGIRRELEIYSEDNNTSFEYALKIVSAAAQVVVRNLN
jgi:hypothetical protein